MLTCPQCFTKFEKGRKCDTCGVKLVQSINGGIQTQNTDMNLQYSSDTEPRTQPGMLGEQVLQSMEINVPKEFLWNILIDFEKFATWNLNTKSSVVLNIRDAVVGTQFSMTDIYGRTTRYEVTEYSKYSLFSYMKIDPDPIMKGLTVEYTLEATGSRCKLLLCFRYDIKTPVVGWLLKKIIKSPLRAQILGILSKIKEISERNYNIGQDTKFSK